MYIDNNLILHVVDDVTRFQVAKWLQNISAKHIWDMLLREYFLNLSYDM
jgi:hypothetical protein